MLLYDLIKLYESAFEPARTRIHLARNNKIPNALSGTQALSYPIHPTGLWSRRIGAQGSTPGDELKGVGFSAELREERAVDAHHEEVALLAALTPYRAIFILAIAALR